MKVGLYFGSFNPIHIGHMAIANFMVEYSSLNQLWFIVSPHNPLKNKKTLLPEYQRLELVNRAINSDNRFKASNIEFALPQPSYTIDTLVHLAEKYPQHEFSLIIGSDNLTSFHKWKNYEILLRDYNILVYPRPDFDETTVTNLTNVEIVRAPNMEISSSFIRKAITEGRNVSHFMPKDVAIYVDEMNFYK